MKNLFAIPRLSLSEAFTILITLVVCLAGFTEAETHSEYKKEDSNRQEENNFLPKESSLKGNDQHTFKASNSENDELKQNYFAYLKNSPGSSFDKLNERYSVYIGESDESDNEKENDGYNYDENEYYHFNYKRNDQNNKIIESNKLEKGKLDEPERKGILDRNYYTKNFKGTKDKDNEVKTIEMLDFKEFHPNLGSDSSQNSIQNQKQFSKDFSHKKIFSSGSLETLNVMDLKDNSAIDETLKDRKEESGSVLSSVPSDSKIAEVKKAVKTPDEKDSVKLKDQKLNEDSEKKDEEVPLKDGKEVISAKNLKDSSKSSEEKEKGVKLSESAKLEENTDKMSSNNKEDDTAKITKDKDMSGFSNKLTSDVINPKELPQINNRANFIGNEYKESLDSMKIPESQINEKNSEEISENEKNVNLNNFPQSIKEKQYGLKMTKKNDNYGLINEHNDFAKVFQMQEKSSPYFTVPLNYEFQQDKSNELHKKRESWKPANNMPMKFPQPQAATSEQTSQRNELSFGQHTQQPQLEISYDPQQKQNNFQNIENSLPTNELENTDYYKNYLKSLRKYKNHNENSKSINVESVPSGHNLLRKITFCDKIENQKKKRSKPKKRRLLLSEEMPKEKEKEQEQITLSNLKNSYETENTVLSPSEKFAVPTNDPQLSLMEGEKENTKLLEGRKREQQLENSRLRRKSPLKLEYEIKVINQSPQDSKNVQLSRFSSTRLKKDIKTKLATGDKYLKKYPYSQVNRDDLIGLNRITESKNEKKSKRKAPMQKSYDQKSIRTRAVPSGYYGNRVKFGQKSYTRNNEKTNSNANIPMNINRISSSYFSPGSPNFDKHYQSGWESKQQSLNGDEDSYLKEDNSLFLVKKGERTVKAFEEGLNKPSVSEELDPEQLAKILSKANDYVVLKKTDNKFRKISDYEPFSFSVSDLDNFPAYNKKSTFAEQLSQYNLENNERPVPLDIKNLRTRSSSVRKDDKKYSTPFRSSISKSSLKKTLDKFKDLADFFKDNEQESSDNQYLTQEAKEGRDIVFSEDKLPDPIIITSDGSEKIEGLSQKPQNSIYSISTNFKNIDMPGKKSESPSNSEDNKIMLTAEVKPDTTDISWNPALKTLFPEANTINSMNENGNEIIVLDFNHNQLKTQHGFHAPQKISKVQSLGTYNPSTPTNPLKILGDRKIQLIFEGSPLSSTLREKSKNENLKNQMQAEQNKKYALLNPGGKQSTISTSLEYNELPDLLKNLIKKNVLTFNTKTVRKKSKEENTERDISESYKQFPKGLNELSEISKSSFEKEYYTDPSEKRNVIKLNLPSSSFSDLSAYSDMSIKQLGNFLQNIVPKGYPMYTEYNSKRGREVSKNSNEYLNLDNAYQDTEKYGADYILEHPSQCFSNENNNEDKMESVLKESKDAINNILQNQEISKIQEKNYAQLKEQIEKASDKFQRLRREEIKKRNLEKTVDKVSTLKENEDTDLKPQEQDMKMSQDFMTLNSNDLIADEKKNEKDSKCQTLNQANESKENSEEEESLDSDYNSHLSELFEHLSKNPKNPSESTWNRQKRFSGRDLDDKVSKTEVQSTILKNLEEDNYQSVYSPGIKRTLLSIKNEAENAEADELNKNTAKETKENCARNADNKCLDPTILELLDNDNFIEGKNRGRRSLTSHFHTNFKREIDLDESLPNDFQNFLVTSLGGVGSQKLEVVKKDDALWEGKENSQNNYKQIAESSSGGKETDEDSALEKREVSSSENLKTQSYSKSDYFSSRRNSDSNFADIMNSFNRAEKKIRSETKSKIRSKSSEFADEKLPTQIRIQITNGSLKEKKSSKPIMDESETSTIEVENLPKEKEFFDKNKVNPLLSNNLPKLHQVPKTKFSYGEFKEDENKNLGDKQKLYHSYQRRKRKKKKFVPENPMKPVKDFIAFDQKAMESLLRKCESNKNMMSDQTTQKIPVSHPLPQVETVYNPTQGTNKAQLETTRLGKMNSINNKDAESSKSSLQSNDASTYDDGIIRSYLKSNQIQSNKEGLKEFEDVDWKPYGTKLEFGQQSGRDNQFEITHSAPKIQAGNPSTFPTNIDLPVLNTYTPNVNTYGQRLYQSPYNRFFYLTPSPNVMSNQFLYDVLKLKQEIKNRNSLNRDHLSNKPYSKPFFFYDSIDKQEKKEKAQNPATPYLTSVGRTWNYFDHNFSRRPYAQKYRMKGYYPLLTESASQIDERSKNPYLTARKFLKNFNFNKLLNFDNQWSAIENYKDIDYLDTTDDDYLDEYPSKDSQFEEPLTKDILNKPHLNKLQETPSYYHIHDAKTPDVEDGFNEDDDELEEDYEENADEEDLDDYSLLTNSNIGDQKLAKNFHETEKLQSYESHPGMINQFKYYNSQVRGHDSDLSKFISNLDDKLDLGIINTDSKINSDPMSRSTTLLQKANEDSEVFGNNVMKSLNRFRNDFAWNHVNQVDRNSNDWHSIIRNDLNMKKFWQEKLKRSEEYPQVGSRVFYATKTEIDDDKDLTPVIKIQDLKDSKSKKRSNYQIPLTDYLHAEFVDLGSGLDYEPEQNERHINKNLMISEKMQKEEHLEEEGDDMKDNLKGDSDAIALDNHLENVIGKYIMRKTTKSSTDSDKVLMKSKEKRDSNVPTKYKIKKRSVQKQKFSEKEPKILKKRLSSGHLTENNFRKYHKKNFSRKRHIKDLDFIPYEVTALITDEQSIKTKNRNTENEKQKKRSALDIFKKITNKERDNKKAENLEGKTAGFEPLLSLTDKKYDNSGKNSLVQDKKSVSEFLQTEPKGNLPELKAHYPNEGQHLRAQLNEKKGERSKEALREYPMSLAQGPWKIDLNDKHEPKASERIDKEPRKSLKSARIMETTLSKDNDENLKAFLVISKNMRRVKRNSDSLFPISGLLRRDMGNSCRPKFVESREISQKQVRKRSLAAIKSSTEGAVKTPEGQFLESHVVNTQEKIRAPRDAKILFEKNSKSRASNELQSNIKKNESFVTANEQCKNSRFLSRERLTESVFSPINDANIIRNCRQIKEETSEHLGQQIVDAILLHVNANPKFKQFIGPGLSMRTAAFKQDTEYNKKRALHQVEFSEQLQAFFKKFMFDLEKMTEKHVKKKMCHEIDKQSKHFLQSLLIAPTENIKQEEKIETRKKISPSNELHLEVKGDENSGSIPYTAAIFGRPEMVNLNQIKEKSLKPEQRISEDLPMKQNFLLTSDNCQNLSKKEKETFGENYPFFLQELDQSRNPLTISKNQLHLVPTSSFRAKNNFRNDTSNINSDKVGLSGTIKLKMLKAVNQSNDQNITVPHTTARSDRIELVRENHPQSAVLETPSDCQNFQTPNNIQPQSLSVYHFSEVENPNKFTELQTTPYNVFELVSPANETESTPNQEVKNEKQDGKTTQEYNLTEYKDRLLVVPTPQSFDLLTYESSTTQSNLVRNDEFLANVKIHKNIVKKKTDDSNFEDHLHQSHDRPKELHKTSLSDAAGSQLSLKYQSPKVSNFDVAKTLRSTSKASEPEAILKANKPLQKDTNQFLKESRNPRSLIIPENEPSAESSFSIRNNWNNKAKYFYSKPVFSSQVDKKFCTPKVRPFGSVTHCKWPTKEQYGPLQYLLRKGSPPNKKICHKNCHGKPLQEEKLFLRQHFGKKRKRKIPHFLIYHPKEGAEKHKDFQDFKNKAKL